MTRQEAMELLKEYTKRENLIQHALGVEAAMSAYARHYGEDVEAWRAVGLLHDFDYEAFPTEEEHPWRGADILRERGVREEWVRAILGHADYTGVPRDSLMARVLYAVDELTGFILASALVRPSRSLDDLSAKSVKKKLKDKRFAAAVSREGIRQGARELGVDLDEHIGFVIEAMRPVQEDLGLKRADEGNH